jgi:hypothetical protein
MLMIAVYQQGRRIPCGAVRSLAENLRENPLPSGWYGPRRLNLQRERAFHE